MDTRVNFDLCIGADGSYSVMRRQLMRVVRLVDKFLSFKICADTDVLLRRMNFQQEYIPHEYIELKMPAGHDEHGSPAFLLDPNHLHIWPRHSFMLIALPNKVITHLAFMCFRLTTFEFRIRLLLAPSSRPPSSLIA